MSNSSYEFSSIKPQYSPSPPQQQQQQEYQVDFPEDVLLEIFVRLPFKSICKFRCVSKSYLSLFMNPSFINSIFNEHVMENCGGINPWTIVNRYCFRNHNGNSNGVTLFTTSSTQLHHEFITTHNGFSFEFTLKLAPKHIFPLASSNGLVLCSLEDNDYPENYFIFNPFTRQFVSLPSSRPIFVEEEGFITSLIEPEIIGFVSDSSTGTYKVIYVPHCCSSPNFDLQIFSSESGEWSMRKVTFSSQMQVSYRLPIVNHNRIWYWMDECGCRMVAYDDNNGGGGGECRLFRLPVWRRGGIDDEQLCLGESNGFLCYGQIEKFQIHQRTVNAISVWVFRDGYEDDGPVWQWVCRDVEIEIEDCMFPKRRKDMRDCACVPAWPRRVDHYSFIAFSPLDVNVVILECHFYDGEAYEFAYNIETRKYEVLRSSHPIEDFYCKADPGSRVVVTPRPTITPVITN